MPGQLLEENKNEKEDPKADESDKRAKKSKKLGQKRTVDKDELFFNSNDFNPEEAENSDEEVVDSESLKILKEQLAKTENSRVRTDKIASAPKLEMETVDLPAELLSLQPLRPQSPRLEPASLQPVGELTPVSRLAKPSELGIPAFEPTDQLASVLVPPAKANVSTTIARSAIKPPSPPTLKSKPVALRNPSSLLMPNPNLARNIERRSKRQTVRRSSQLENQTPDNVFKMRLSEMAQKQTENSYSCLLYTSPSPRDQRGSRMPSSA